MYPAMIAAATPEHLPGVLHGLEPTLDRFGYLAVVGLVLIEDFGIPVPGETVLILAAVYAGTGRLNIVLVGLLGFVGALLGDNIGFAIGHFGGRPLLDRYGRFIFLTPDRVARATGFFDRHGGWIIIVARFVEGLRQANGIIAGMSGIHWAKFLVFNAIGAALWVGRVDERRLSIGEPHQHDLRHRYPLLHLRRDRPRRATPRIHRPTHGQGPPSQGTSRQLRRGGAGRAAVSPGRSGRRRSLLARDLAA